MPSPTNHDSYRGCMKNLGHAIFQKVNKCLGGAFRGFAEHGRRTKKRHQACPGSGVWGFSFLDLIWASCSSLLRTNTVSLGNTLRSSLLFPPPPLAHLKSRRGRRKTTKNENAPDVSKMNPNISKQYTFRGVALKTRQPPSSGSRVTHGDEA